MCYLAGEWGCQSEQPAAIETCKGSSNVWCQG